MSDERHSDAPRDLLRDVLANTSGSPCTQAEERLPAFVDGELLGMDHQLVHRHARACQDCGPLIVALNRLQEALPPLADLSPGPGFAAHVYAATSRSQTPLRPRGIRDFLQGLGQLRRRPRLHLEAGYLGAVVIWLLVLAPFAPMRELPGTVASFFDTQEQHSLPRQAEQVWQVTGEAGIESVRNLTDRIERRVEQSAPARDTLDRNYHSLREAVQDQDPQRSGEALNGMGDGLEGIWQAMTGQADGRDDNDDSEDNDAEAGSSRPLRTPLNEWL
ncbi:MAG: zf-HC2 domain-containing protein [Acidobacteriota bacterium]|nr:zf-HC2 domain-containing protein [Acidobacteriota bacterium]MDH3786288.1 zf-HC2 domain-containing protein [Acidobacteriota bacterium]